MADLRCPICSDWLIEPSTLLCQHTFCQTCIRDRSIKQCPICRMAKFAPPEVNTLVRDIVKDRIGEQAYWDLAKEKKADMVKKYERWQTSLEIERGLWRTIAETLYSMPRSQAAMNSIRGSNIGQFIDDFMERPFQNLCMALVTVSAGMAAARLYLHKSR